MIDRTPIHYQGEIWTVMDTRPVQVTEYQIRQGDDVRWVYGDEIEEAWG